MSVDRVVLDRPALDQVEPLRRVTPDQPLDQILDRLARVRW
ncbi:MAG TPA: hypothetical protein VFT61_00380 [Sphingomicrobium sp.]|nr:hypothetical protein [Sphingomicrobium sp.]